MELYVAWLEIAQLQLMGGLGKWRVGLGRKLGRMYEKAIWTLTTSQPSG